MRSSPARYTFQAQSYVERCKEKGEEPRQDYMNIYINEKVQMIERETNEDWKKNNLEYDLRTNDYIWKKCQDPVYAQNLYAALCNNDFIKNEVWPLLKEETWGCSWRYAGGIIADIREQGDYIDWYCSGTARDDSGDHVREGEVTDQIRQDLKSMGWLIIEEGE